jgi:hypothetical protein
LVEESVPSLGLVIQDALAEMGYASTLAPSLEHALHMLHQRPLDLIVIDTSPAISPDALASLRPLLALSHPLPVVLCTLWPLSEIDLRHAKVAGWVQHPFTRDQLVTTVAACLNQPWSPAQLSQAEVVQHGVAALVQRDVGALVALCTEEVQWYPWLVPPYPRAHPVMGRAAVRAYLEEATAYLGAYQIDVVHLYPCPHGVAVRALLHWQDHSGGWKEQEVACCVKTTPKGQISQIGLPYDERLRAQLSSLRGA